uniref:Uncharacterized protein n=1 Tax=viral metagenome TaxID=1070528 RepID=A0A6C0IFW9_9ZZZZ
MRIYSNKELSPSLCVALSRMVEFPRIGFTKDDMVYRVDVNTDCISFFKTNMYTKAPIGFSPEFVSDYNDYRQVKVCALDLKTYDMCGFGKIYTNAIQLPKDLSNGDLVYVDTKKLL